MFFFSGFESLSYDGTPTDFILDFYKKFWGVPLPQEHLALEDSIHDFNDGGPENDEENGDDSDVLPTTPPPTFESPWMKVFIRAEYLRIYKFVEDMYTNGKVYRPSAVVVTGQPGIGQYSVINTRSFFFDTLLHRKNVLGLLRPTSTSWGKVYISVVSRIRALSLLFRRGPPHPCYILLH